MGTQNGQDPSPAAPQIPPAPVPTQFFTQTITATDGSRWGLLTCVTPVGQMTYWLPKANAVELAAMLAAVAQQLEETGSAGLIVPAVDVREVIRKIEEDGRG